MKRCEPRSALHSHHGSRWRQQRRHFEKSSASAVDRWASSGDSPCAAQTRPPPTNPERPPSSRHTDASAESWCAALHQGVACAQGQDVVVAHQPGGGGNCRNRSLRPVNGTVGSHAGVVPGGIPKIKIPCKATRARVATVTAALWTDRHLRPRDGDQEDCRQGWRLRRPAAVRWCTLRPRAT